MDIGKILLTENECYKYGQKIKPNLIGGGADVD